MAVISTNSVQCHSLTYVVNGTLPLRFSLKFCKYAGSTIQNNTARTKYPKNNHMTSTDLFLASANS
jgi:hypothetical protein